MDGSDKQAAIRVARNQALFRSVNEQIEIADERFTVILNERVDFVCECADHTCNRITVTLAQYEAVGRFPTHFIVKAGHVYREFERIVEEIDGFVIVEKFGEPASRRSS